MQVVGMTALTLREELVVSWNNVYAIRNAGDDSITISGDYLVRAQIKGGTSMVTELIFLELGMK